jgi:hypothetical protein
MSDLVISLKENPAHVVLYKSVGDFEWAKMTLIQEFILDIETVDSIPKVTFSMYSFGFAEPELRSKGSEIVLKNFFHADGVRSGLPLTTLILDENGLIGAVQSIHLKAGIGYQEMEIVVYKPFNSSNIQLPSWVNVVYKE